MRLVFVRSALLLALLASALVPGGRALAQATPTSSAPMLNVVATTTQVQDFVRNVGGNLISVFGILGPTDDPHEYQPTADDARAVANANIVFENGAGLETWFASLGSNARPSTL